MIVDRAEGGEDAARRRPADVRHDEADGACRADSRRQCAAVAGWLEREVARTGVTTVVATAEMAIAEATRQPFDLAIVDLMLPDGDGLSSHSSSFVSGRASACVVMTGGELSPDEITLCDRHEFPVLRKPFLRS